MKAKRNLGDFVYSAMVYGAAISAIVFISGVALYQCHRMREAKKNNLENQLEAPEEKTSPKDANARQSSFFMIRDN